MPWIIAAAATFALIAVVVVVVSRPEGSGPASPFAQGGGEPGPTDLTSMTPREAADRLFNRVMTAAEGGDTAGARFFAPMAIQAYSNAAPLDTDGRLHVGSVHLVLGNTAGALAEADTIAGESPSHLFATLLRARSAQASGDAAGARRAWGRFIDDYDGERARNLDEYGQHDVMLTQARSEARQLLGR